MNHIPPCTSSPPTIQVLIVDDEPLARHWLRMQLGKCRQPVAIAEAPSAALALDWLQKNTCQVLLLDIHMPGMSGIDFAKKCQALVCPPSIIFVTADASFALKAFELAAFDYLTKPVSVERLEEALDRVCARTPSIIKSTSSAAPPAEAPAVVIDGPQHLIRVPLSQVLYFQADNKYVRVVTTSENYLIEESLNTLEKQFGEFVIRTHRGFLVPKHAITALMRVAPEETITEGWSIQIRGTNALLPVSRRQLAQVREILHQP